jgi:hypothetical protein
MSGTSRHRSRAPRSSEVRARNWARQHERNTLAARPETAVAPSLGAFTVSRAVLAGTPGGIFEKQELLDMLVDDSQTRVYRRIGVSQINPREGKQMSDPWQNSLHTNISKLQEVAEEFPEKLDGFVTSAIILGARRNQPGRRFVGYVIDGKMGESIRAEREHLMSALGVEIPQPKTPHTTLFETEDQHRAEELRLKLNDIAKSLGGIPVELGVTEVIPIQNHSMSRPH